MKPESIVTDIAAAAPATISVFQRHRIEFCCAGHVPLAEACRERALDVDVVLRELRQALEPPPPERDWTGARLTSIVEHIQRRYHQPLREELPRLGAMLQRVVTRHGDRLPERLLLLQRTFERLRAELLLHLMREERVVFPAIVALDAVGQPCDPAFAAAIRHPIELLQSEHRDTATALASMREATDGYAPPEWACLTFRGLYYGFSRLETELQLHTQLEDNVLFPRAVHLAGRASVAGRTLTAPPPPPNPSTAGSPRD